MIIVPVSVPDAGQPLPDPTDMSTWAVRMGEMHRWERLDARPGFNALAEASYQNALDAAASAEAAQAAAGAAIWSAPTNYATGVAVKSPITYRTYVRKSPGGTNATDPSAAPTLWEPLSVTRVNGSMLEFWDGTQWVPQGWVHSVPVSLVGLSTLDLNGIPSYANEIAIDFQKVSANTANNPQIRVGTAASFLTTGYLATTTYNNLGGSTVGFAAGNGFLAVGNGAVVEVSGDLILRRGVNHRWRLSGELVDRVSGLIGAAGVIDVGAQLTRLQVFLAAGTFDGTSAVALSWRV